MFRSTAYSVLSFAECTSQSMILVVGAWQECSPSLWLPYAPPTYEYVWTNTPDVAARFRCAYDTSTAAARTRISCIRGSEASLWTSQHVTLCQDNFTGIFIKSWKRQLWVRPFEWLKLNFAICVVHQTCWTSYNMVLKFCELPTIWSILRTQVLQNIVRACSMFYPYEGYRSVTPLDAARVNRTIFRNHSVHWYYITLIKVRDYIKHDINVRHGKQYPRRGRWL